MKNSTVLTLIAGTTISGVCLAQGTLPPPFLVEPMCKYSFSGTAVQQIICEGEQTCNGPSYSRSELFKPSLRFLIAGGALGGFIGWGHASATSRWDRSGTVIGYSWSHAFRSANDVESGCEVNFVTGLSVSANTTAASPFCILPANIPPFELPVPSSLPTVKDVRSDGNFGGSDSNFQRDVFSSQKYSSARVRPPEAPCGSESRIWDITDIIEEAGTSVYAVWQVSVSSVAEASIDFEFDLCGSSEIEPPIGKLGTCDTSSVPPPFVATAPTAVPIGYNIYGVNLTTGESFAIDSGVPKPSARFLASPSNCNPAGTKFVYADASPGVWRFRVVGGMYSGDSWAAGHGGVPTCLADIANTDGELGADGVVDSGDFGVFFELFFGVDPGPSPVPPAQQCVVNAAVLFADIASTDGDPVPDGVIDNGDFAVFFTSFVECSAP